MISLGGGLPSSDYFPFDSLDLSIPNPPQFASGSSSYRIGKHDIRDGKSVFDLHVSLNYAQSMGAPQLLRFVTEHTELIHNPPYSDWDCCLTAGSTSALDMALRMFCSRGDYLLTEEYTFSSAVDTADPMGIRMVGVAVDSEGMLDTSLDEILTNWDPVVRGGPKPFVLYIVPTGQNPTGATQSLQRRKAIYAVAEKHDLYILEDEPYYFLQMQTYHSHASSITTSGTSTPLPTDHQTFIHSLVPSYLSIDTSGRVLRLDSFSKVIAPGSRTGWVTGSAQIIERFVRHCEVSVQTASGISQIVLFKLLDEAWGHTGYLDWLIYLRKEYTRRRDVLVSACEKDLSTLRTLNLVSWTPPTAGMFFWLQIDHQRHPLFLSLKKLSGTSEHEIVQKIEDKIFLSLVDEGVLVGKGSWFRAETDTDKEMFFRMTFAAASEEKIVEAIERLGKGLEREFLL